ncbi:allophanate hydrolase, subunit 2 [Hyphomonas neptunium ATCC 15444]|uniref:Allophanate hydrolase, subunit 2 n=2 Tax=Hyphomonas TaxID=85 RepID=Q0C0C3_HYPNA|nr:MULTISPECIES: biotin-dependent carboxyltransferase family protein [Hyphomonas]ABI76290.1 allophanate hydrolase, subunit 2 [Hyphomonas neptunium ATCC 15444]KCZ90599.1 allophanate hydrolase subunit 2 [Hyphomonas hirschiana VP5]
MVLTVLKSGPLATLQGRAREGLRHQGIPASGPADPLSMALANRLVGNPQQATALEITFGAAEFEFHQDTVFAFAGAAAGASLAGAPVPAHQALEARRGDRLAFAYPSAGVRSYLAVPAGFAAENVFDSTSTFLPAAFGGFSGRALQAGDVLTGERASGPALDLTTPAALRPHMSRTHILRCVPGPDFESIGPAIWPETFQTTNRMDRTGLELSGPWPQPQDGGQKPSAALFTGAVQLTPSGNAFVLLPDAQTTGGYPHVLQVIRADRHLLGQIAPGDRVRFLRRSVDEAYEDLRAKTDYFAAWLPGFAF